MNKREFGNIMSAVHAAYPGEKITGDANTVKLWWQMLCDMDYASASKNLQRHIKTNKFAPSISEIRVEGPRGLNNFTGHTYDMDKLELALLGVIRMDRVEEIKE